MLAAMPASSRAVQIERETPTSKNVEAWVKALKPE
jgi:hypothetical protein